MAAFHPLTLTNRSRDNSTSTLRSLHARQRSESRKLSGWRSAMKAPTRHHDASPGALREGSAVRVFSRSANEWMDAEIVQMIEGNFVRVEYLVGEDWCGKLLAIDSEHLLFPTRATHPTSPNYPNFAEDVCQISRHSDCEDSEEFIEHDPGATGVIRDLNWYTSIDSIWEVLEGGDVVLIKGLWLLRQGANRAILPCRQELPLEAVWEVEDLKQQFRRPHLLTGPPEIVAISHCWFSVEHPDPQGSQLQDLCPFLEELEGLMSVHHSQGSDHVAIFWSYCSLYQPRRRIVGGTKEFLPFEEASRQRALQNMHFWYAHERIHTWCHTKVPRGLKNYYERGWPTWERCVALLITGLGNSSATFFSYGACVLDVCAISADDCRRLTYSDIVDKCQMIRQPPLTPEQFDNLIEDKVFTARNADLPLIKSKYKEAFSQILGNVRSLRYRSLGWDVIAVRQLCRVLPHCHALEDLDLSDNFIDVDGCKALAKTLPKCQSLRTLHFVDNPARYGRGILRERCPNLKIHWDSPCGQMVVRAVQGMGKQMVADAATLLTTPFNAASPLASDVQAEEHEDNSCEFGSFAPVMDTVAAHSNTPSTRTRKLTTSELASFL